MLEQEEVMRAGSWGEMKCVVHKRERKLNDRDIDTLPAKPCVCAATPHSWYVCYKKKERLHLLKWDKALSHSEAGVCTEARCCECTTCLTPPKVKLQQKRLKNKAGA